MVAPHILKIRSLFTDVIIIESMTKALPAYPNISSKIFPFNIIPPSVKMFFEEVESESDRLV